VEGQDRLVKSVICEFTPEGKLIKTDFANGVICSIKRLTYKVAYAFLNGAKNAGLLAAQIIGSTNAQIGQAMDDYRLNMESEVMTKVENLKGTWNNEFDLK
jgi:exoribonuclease R